MLYDRGMQTYLSEGFRCPEAFSHPFFGDEDYASALRHLRAARSRWPCPTANPYFETRLRGILGTNHFTVFHFCAALLAQTTIDLIITSSQKTETIRP